MTLRPFAFRTVPSIEVEWSGARRLGARLAGRFAARRVLLVTDAGLVRAGLIEPIAGDLRAEGFEVAVFDGVVADPPEAVLLATVEAGRAAGAEMVVGLGGGSSLDIAKLAAVLLASHTFTPDDVRREAQAPLGLCQPLADLYGIDRVRGHRLPLVLVPTTAGTGSEVTNIAILTTGETTKMGVVAPQLYADHVLLDAELTVGLPAIHTAATGIDAMVHAIEAYTSRHRKNPISDALAREALRLLSAHLVAACRTGTDRAAREGMLLGAMLAGQAFSNAPVAAVHALAYPLGGHFHVPHGLSNALMLGPVLRFNASAAAPLYAELAEVLDAGRTGRGAGRTGSDAGRTGSVAERADAFVAAMQDLMDESGAPRRLRDVGVGEDRLPRLAADAMLQTRLLVNNPVDVTEADALALYREAY